MSMPISLQDPAVDTVLQATPSTTVTGGGARIPYPFPSPVDWRDHWIYFLLVDRFNNPVQPPRSADPYNLYQGGTFEGIRQQLPYLKNLGVGAIWVSPVLMNPQWFQDYWGGYGVLDFLRIEPRFCSNPNQARQNPNLADQEFRTLVDEAHAQGIFVILDIVLNHVGDVFNYEGMRDEAPWNAGGEYRTYWRNAQGVAQGNWTDIGAVGNLPAEAGIWPQEFQRNDYFRRRGTSDASPDPSQGDFSRMKELVTEYLIPGTGVYPVRNLLIRAYQYLIAKFDLDGYRIDTLQYVEADFARVFGNAMREYALSIGKKNFLTFGEVWQDDEERIAEFIGRNTKKDGELVGVDSAIDFPMRRRLVDAAKGLAPPRDLAAHFDYRREVLKTIVSSHGDASRYYVTFLDNHDLNERFHNAAYPRQTSLALTCLMTMQGLPCIYYGTEQGLDGHGTRREYAREALWGRQNAFSSNRTLYRAIRNLSSLRDRQPALRYGRQYFRVCSGNSIDFGYSSFKGGIIAFSRILNDREILVVANTNTAQNGVVHVAVDANLNPDNRIWQILFSTRPQPTAPAPTATHGSYRTVQVTLAPMEAQVLG
jgi:glycosidase